MILPGLMPRAFTVRHHRRALVTAGKEWPGAILRLLESMAADLARQKPFGFARFNDGEMGAITSRAAVIAREHQQVTANVTRALRESLSQPSEGVIIGIPCPACWPEEYLAARAMVPSNSRQAPATALQNALHRVTQHWLLGTLADQSDRDVHWIGSSNHDLRPLRELLGRTVHHAQVPDREGFDETLTVVEALIPRLSQGDVVLLSCGPASRVGVMSIMRRVEGVTALDVGSLFDPWTRGIRLPYHDDPDLRQCPACAGPVRTKRWTSVHERLVDRGSA